MSGAAGVRFDLHKVARVDVGGRNDPSIRTDTQAEYGDELPRIFRDYVNEIATMNDTGDVSAGIYRGDSPQRDFFDDLRDPDLPLDEFEEGVAEVGIELNDRMAGKSAATGTLFVAQTTFDGPNVDGEAVDAVVLLKMSTEAVGRLIRRDGDLEPFEEDEVYPAVSDIQKAAVYPLFQTETYNRTGDVKLYDQSDSEYFEVFLGCETVDASLDQFNNLSSAISRLKQRDGNGRVQRDDIERLEERAAEHDGLLRREHVRGVLDSITSDDTTPDDIDDELDEDGIREIDTENATTPAKFKYSVETGGDSVDIKLPLELDDHVEVVEAGGEVRVVVTGDDVSKTTTG